MIHKHRGGPSALTARRTAAAWIAVVLALASVAWAQEKGDTPDTEAAPNTQQNQAQQETQAEDADDGEDALAAFGVSVGLPSGQIAAATFSVQVRHVGMMLGAGYGDGGPSGRVAVRGYAPFETPVPLYLTGGAVLRPGAPDLLAGVGAHVPLDVHWRVDVEAGAARGIGRDAPGWRAHLAAGVSYAFPFDPDTAPRVDEAGGATTDQGPCGEPTEANLRGQVGSVISSVRDDLEDQYGDDFTDLSYSYEVVRVSVSGESGTIEIRYEGSVTEVETGERHSGSGRGSADFRWDGCHWQRTSVDY